MEKSINLYRIELIIDGKLTVPFVNLWRPNAEKILEFWTKYYGEDRNIIVKMCQQ